MKGEVAPGQILCQQHSARPNMLSNVIRNVYVLSAFAKGAEENNDI